MATQKRASGDPYFSHPLEVAAILTDLKLDDATIAAALLHDTIEDTEATRAEIDELFGPEIGALVEGLTKLKKLDLVSKEAEQAENLRKLLLAIADDVRVLLVKLADRLHNMRTLGTCRPRSAAASPRRRSTSMRRSPGRMGMQEMREELEDLAFRELYPEAYAVISAAPRRRSRTATTGLIAEIEQQLTSASSPSAASRPTSRAARSGLIRSGARWSASRSPSSSSPTFSASASIVQTVENCYQALGIVHTTWPVVPGRFKDYISTPKQNDYRSIHTTVVGPGRQRVELQIRTERDARDRRIRHRRARALQGWRGSPSEMLSREFERLCVAAPHHRACWPKAPTRRNFSSTPSSNCSRTRCSASPRRAG